MGLLALDYDAQGRHVAFAFGREWLWSDVEVRFPGLAAEAVLRRDLNQARFDRFHPVLGHLMASPDLSTGVDGTPDVPESVLPPIVPPPVHIPCIPVHIPDISPPATVVPEPTTGLLVFAGLLICLGVHLVVSSFERRKR